MRDVSPPAALHVDVGGTPTPQERRNVTTSGKCPERCAGLPIAPARIRKLCKWVIRRTQKSSSLAQNLRGTPPLPYNTYNNTTAPKDDTATEEANVVCFGLTEDPSDIEDDNADMHVSIADSDPDWMEDK